MKKDDGPSDVKRPEVAFLSSSIARGAEKHLKENHSVDCDMHSYSSNNIYDLTEKALKIFTPKYQPKNVIIQAAGIDTFTKTCPQIMTKYRNLTATIQALCPNSEIIVSAIPSRERHGLYRGSDRRVNIMNTSIKGHANLKKLKFMNAAPVPDSMYRRDGIHFNEEGCKKYASNVYEFLSTLPNFNVPIQKIKK